MLCNIMLLPEDGLRTETCRSVLNVLMCKFYICAVVGVIIECPYPVIVRMD